MKRYVLSAVAIVSIAAVPADAQVKGIISFPDTPDGLRVLAVDTHVHTIFSDGSVWPATRVIEAARDGFDAFAITDHIDTQRYHHDVPNPDRNRSFEIAREAAAKAGDRTLVIRGVEIADPGNDFCDECGHFNALFITDANALRHEGWNGILKFSYSTQLKNAFEATAHAKKQGAFVIWNHPVEKGDFTISKPVSSLMKAGTIGGIEVVNGKHYFEGAFQFALDNDLAIIGASDIHETLENSFDRENGERRTATLVLATDKTESALKSAFEGRRTVALFHENLLGRERDLRSIVEASLSFRFNDAKAPTQLVIRNASSSPFALLRRGADRLLTPSHMLTVPARGELVLRLYAPSRETAQPLDFEVLNALIGPRKPLPIRIGTDGRIAPVGDSRQPAPKP